MRHVTRTRGERGLSTVELTMALPLVLFAMLMLIGMGHALISKQHAVVGGQLAAHHQRVREAAANAQAVGRAVSAGSETFRLSGGGDETLSYTASAAPHKGVIAQRYPLNAESQYHTPRVTNACVPNCKPFDSFARLLSPEIISGIIFSGRGGLSDDLLSIISEKGNKSRRQLPPGVDVTTPVKASISGGGLPPGGGGGGTGGNKKRPIDRVNELERSGKLQGNLTRLKKDLESPDRNTRLSAEAELKELENEIAAGRTPVVRGAQPGPDQPDYEVKARTEPFKSEKNAQNFFNNRIKEANEQFKGEKNSGRVVINLGEETKIVGKPITREAARDLVREALSKGGRGTNITKVVVKDGSGKIIYEGLGE